MKKKKKVETCPFCGSDNNTRLHRKMWMRLLLGSMRMSCSQCQGVFLILMNKIKIPLKEYRF